MADDHPSLDDDEDHGGGVIVIVYSALLLLVGIGVGFMLGWAL